MRIVTCILLAICVYVGAGAISGGVTRAQNTAQPTLVTVYDFYTPSCKRCMQEKPILQEAQRRGYGTVYFIDASDPDNQSQVKAWGVTTVPMYFVYVNGWYRLKTTNLEDLKAFVPCK